MSDEEFRDALAASAFASIIGRAQGLGLVGKEDRTSLLKMTSQIIYEAVDAMMEARKPKGSSDE